MATCFPNTNLTNLTNPYGLPQFLHGAIREIREIRVQKESIRIATILTGDCEDPFFMPKARELRELLQNLYTQVGQDEDMVVYQLKIPNHERKRFEGLLRQFGLAASNMRKVISHVAF